MKFYSVSNVPEENMHVKGFMLFEESQLPEELSDFRHIIAHIHKKKSIQFIPQAEPSAGWLAVVSLGKRPECEKKLRNICRDRTADFVRAGTAMDFSVFAATFPKTSDVDISSAVAEGAVLGNYRFTKYKTEKETPTTQCSDFYLVDGDEIELQRGRRFAEAQTLARDIANEPGNSVTPEAMAERASLIAAAHGMEITVLNDQDIRKEGLLALWHVGMGSINKPRLVHMVYRPQKTPVGRAAIVGKCVTFDSGGLSIKTRDGMRTMKFDKSGACNVLGIMDALSSMECPWEVHGLFGAVENMPDGGSYRPDDIIKALNGKTIEINNTDAEGRLTLADMLTYASRLSPDFIIDIATLTGSAAKALGNYTAALVSDYDELCERILSASKKAGERFHRFNMDDEKLREQINTPNADVTNSGGPNGGVISAGMFLREFVSPEIPWAHLDIAAVDCYDREFSCYSFGATGYSLRTCLELLSKEK